ncbi:MAG: ATP-binding protein [Candidatus Hydrogenedentes bacterium]|nr:ATP-binding protein [Candidatus Hydrogenedentota bacterium]
MLVEFETENWTSFRETAKLTMVATSERQHRERLAQLPKYEITILPIASIYGGNASGKSNLWKAMRFSKQFILDGTRPDMIIPIEPFNLDNSARSEPVRFGFRILVNEIIYAYDFAVTREHVESERLARLGKTCETVLYERMQAKIVLHKQLPGRERLQIVFDGTRANQLFLTNAVSQNIQDFRPVYDWFRDKLVLIGPSSLYEPFEQFFRPDHPLSASVNELLTRLDTGVSRLGVQEVQIEQIPVLTALKQELEANLREGAAVRVVSNDDERYLVRREDHRLHAARLVSFHKDINGDDMQFDMSQESDGSRRVIDLAPAFLELANGEAGKVYFIDELDRSLHTLLCRELIEAYLESCSSKGRSQLIFTTHDVNLMDQQVFRRDETWVTERKRDGETTLYSFSEFKDVRNDKDIRKSYLQGRLGGIPKLLVGGVLAGSAEAQYGNEVD